MRRRSSERITAPSRLNNAVVLHLVMKKAPDRIDHFSKSAALAIPALAHASSRS
jgi:hypothetical protein